MKCDTNEFHLQYNTDSDINAHVSIYSSLAWNETFYMWDLEISQTLNIRIEPQTFWATLVQWSKQLKNLNLSSGSWI